MTRSPSYVLDRIASIEPRKSSTSSAGENKTQKASESDSTTGEKDDATQTNDDQTYVVEKDGVTVLDNVDPSDLIKIPLSDQNNLAATALVVENTTQ